MASAWSKDPQPVQPEVPAGAPAGLMIYHGVIDEACHDALVAFAEHVLARGRAGLLRGKSYQAPPVEWRERGQGRETVHFGVLVKCNKVLNADVEPLPPIVEALYSHLQQARSG